MAENPVSVPPVGADASPKKSSSPESDRLVELFARHFGDDWRRELSITMRADRWYWLVNLIEAGIAARLDQWRKEPGGIDASAAASIGDFRATVHELADRLERTLPPKKSPKSSKESK